MATKTPPVEKTKTQLFLEELQKLLDKYQYGLKTVIKYTEDKIYPELTLVNVPPKEVKK